MAITSLWNRGSTSYTQPSTFPSNLPGAGLNSRLNNSFAATNCAHGATAQRYYNTFTAPPPVPPPVYRPPPPVQTTPTFTVTPAQIYRAPPPVQTTSTFTNVSQPRPNFGKADPGSQGELWKSDRLAKACVGAVNEVASVETMAGIARNPAKAKEEVIIAAVVGAVKGAVNNS